MLSISLLGSRKAAYERVFKAHAEEAAAKKAADEAAAKKAAEKTTVKRVFRSDANKDEVKISMPQDCI